MEPHKWHPISVPSLRDQCCWRGQPIGGLRPDFTKIGTGYLGPNGDLSIPYLILVAAAIIVCYWIMLNKTRLGKNIYAIGGNSRAATVSGVNVPKNLILVYAIAGCLYGLVGRAGTGTVPAP